MFESAWRLERDLFISRSMNGQNWPKIRTRYARLLPLLGSRDDLNWLLGEMLGELGNSHVYVGGGDQGETFAAVRSAHLGVDWALDEGSGRYRLKKIYVGDNTRDEYRSPLAQPGLNIKNGDYVLAINGVELRAPTVPAALMEGLDPSHPIKLMIADSAGGARRQVVVSPVGSEMNLREAGLDFP